uniref:Uncharacterized protein n=1 Tax=Rhodospirillum rubrum TaxID=1085 RepID=UPI00084A2DF7|nr:Chain A, Uncharacterized protein [Rhodospirillum rubrum]5L8G_B Chain B, Uncharacterized protein [Rhodospirillum rubrum]5L8G_C Chain C, Uncharacterized protein [Rhodospirillum rubrum]5L8G_D Chain D, Uncharacterized protein [Rhodospirillum rubrum]5L8G_E Chain E, Uncharacterized protein [Rhodospirillum rubrum]5L8G_F Chain F, Uncharacterized protein [Rhodospirillum rubrum]5L8G_G Chain G, Uncharacterized protein [Rhodospirillum rubrum]5L8G_H Chain H, Uncharacterized protein [Rhodospirillum rub
MAQSSNSTHEPLEVLKEETVNRHRAIVSVMEELEAVDWYDQRVDASTDPELTAILAHNRDEEKEAAAMTLEWLRRNDAKWAEHLRTYLFTEGPITAANSSSVDKLAAALEHHHHHH